MAGRRGRSRAESRRLAGRRARSTDQAESVDGEAFSLRWILCHMIEEYARHNGHADLLRESVDGAHRRVTAPARPVPSPPGRNPLLQTDTDLYPFEWDLRQRGVRTGGSVYWALVFFAAISASGVLLGHFSERKKEGAHTLLMWAAHLKNAEREAPPSQDEAEKTSSVWQRLAGKLSRPSR